jgi:hypothetical protein
MRYDVAIQKCCLRPAKFAHRAALNFVAPSNNSWASSPGDPLIAPQFLQASFKNGTA